MSAIQRLEIEGVKSHSFPIQSRSLGQSGTLDVNYETGEAVLNLGGRQTKAYDINSNEFKRDFEDAELELY